MKNTEFLKSSRSEFKIVKKSLDFLSTVIINTNISFSKHFHLLPIINFFVLFYDCIYIICDNYNDINIISLYNNSKIKILKFINSNIIGDQFNINDFNYYYDLYTDLKFSELIFWKYFNIPITNNSIYLINILKDNKLNFIFINNSSELFTTSYIENILDLKKDNILFLNPDKNHYKPNDNFFEIANLFMNHLVIDYINIICNSNHIILSDEKYINMTLHLNINSNKSFIYNNDNFRINKFINIKPQKIIFLTFGGGNINYHNAVKRLCEQANNFKIFSKIYGFTENDLINDSIFWNEHSQFILNNPRGLGYWIWKGYLMKKIMESNEIEENDIILYLDCGCELNIYGKERFIDYIDMTNKYNNLAFYMPECIEKVFTKMDLFKYMNTSTEDMNSGQLVGGIVFLKKNNDNLNFLNELNDLYKCNNYHFVDDTPSIEPNDILFNENRHDQSCYSLLIKKYKMFKIPGEIYFEPNWLDGIKYPILTFRNKSGNSILDSLLRNNKSIFK
jgi:hypothetical protein